MTIDQYVALAPHELATAQMLKDGLDDVLRPYFYDPIGPRLLQSMSEIATREVERVTASAGPVMGCPGMQIRKGVAVVSKVDRSRINFRWFGDFCPKARYEQPVITRPVFVPLGYYGRYDLYAILVNPSDNEDPFGYIARYGNDPSEFIENHYCYTSLKPRPFEGDFYEQEVVFSMCFRRTLDLGLKEV